MKLQVSYNWLKEYLPGLKATPEEVAEKLSLHAFSVERWRRMDENLEGVVIGEIVEFHKHPNADKLSVAKVDIGREKPLQLIFGQMVTMHVGDKVPVAIAPTTLPGGRKIEKAKMRGELSEGMLCLDQELGLLETGVSIRYFDASVKNGTPIAKVLELDDTVLEVEITSNRPDATGMVGLGREVGAIFNIKLKMQNEKLNVARDFTSRKGGTRGAALHVRVEVPKLCPRYIAVAIDGVKVAPSPWWMQRRLMASGVRPINNIVDITNYVLLEYGQPCHAFDYEKLRYLEARPPGARRPGLPLLIVRTAKKGEKILALDGNTYEVDENILVIADVKRPVAIAGIMGGEETGVHEETTRIVYEIANFDPLTVRRGEHQLGLSSESSVRFNKGLPVQLPGLAAARLIELTKEVVGGEVAQVVDRHNPPRPSLILREGDRSRPPLKIRGGRGNYESKVQVSPQEVVKKIGVDIPAAQMKEYLKALGFEVKPATERRSLPLGGGVQWRITFPYWRTLEADGVADIAEEVARMYGYHKIPGVLPQGDLPTEAPNVQFVQEHAIKETLRGAGFTELYTYSFVSRDDVARAGFNPDRDALMLANPLSSEMTHMRPWLGVSVLKAVERNQKEREMLKLFELSAEYHPRDANNESVANLRITNPEIRRFGSDSQFASLPDERQKLIIVSAGREGSEGEHFYAIKGMAEHLAERLSLSSFGYEKVGSTKAPWVAHYHPSRVLLCKSGRDILGVVGELHPQLTRAFGIDGRVAFLEWEMKALLPLIGRGRAYVPPPLYPPVKRDIAFIVSREVEYAKIHGAIAALDPLVSHVELFDEYEGKGVPEDSRSLAFHISYASPERTLTAQEADKVHEKLVKMLEDKFNARMRA